MLDPTRIDTRTFSRAAMALALTLAVAAPRATAQQPVAAPATYTVAPSYTTAPAMPTVPSAVFATTPTTTYTTPAAAPGYTYAAPAYYASPATTVAATAYRYAAPAATYTYGATAGDPYGFTAWLNGVRAQYGLGPVSYDPNLAGWAAANNAQQAARGLGHFVMGPARRQNSAMGNAASVGSQWMNSPAHRSAMLDPSVTTIGLAGNGSYWTLNLR